MPWAIVEWSRRSDWFEEENPHDPDDDSEDDGAFQAYTAAAIAWLSVFVCFFAVGLVRLLSAVSAYVAVDLAWVGIVCGLLGVTSITARDLLLPPNCPDCGLPYRRSALVSAVLAEP